MSDIRFYHLTATGLEAALPRLLEKTLARDWRAVVAAGSETRVESLAELLWTYDDRSFLPHGTAKDGHAALQPVWLATDDANVNNAQVLFLTDGLGTERLAAYQVIAEIFDGGDPEAVQAARRHWRAYTEVGHAPSYWKQDPDGRWIKAA